MLRSVGTSFTKQLAGSAAGAAGGGGAGGSEAPARTPTSEYAPADATKNTLAARADAIRAGAATAAEREDWTALAKWLAAAVYELEVSTSEARAARIAEARVEAMEVGSSATPPLAPPRATARECCAA